jgi:hypothetical protein
VGLNSRQRPLLEDLDAAIRRIVRKKIQARVPVDLTPLRPPKRLAYPNLRLEGPPGRTQIQKLVLVILSRGSSDDKATPIEVVGL